VNRARGGRPGCGCSGLPAFLLAALAGGAVIGWPIYLDTAGTQTSGVIIEKRESVRMVYDEWFRRFEVTASYSIPEQPVQHRAVCDVDEETYDSLHPGRAVVVHYFRNLLFQPFLPATRLAPCSSVASIRVNFRRIRPLIAIVLALLAILFVWRVLRIRIAAWLLLAWLCVAFYTLVLPRAEPDPQQPLPARATVDSITAIDTVGESSESEGIPLPQPYQVVQLKFVPPGMDTAVTVVDKVDEDSVPALKEGQSVAIVYDAANVRVARIQGGTRSFPERARMLVILCCIGLAVLAWGFGRLFRKARRRLPS
jgi:hypothetical protein